MPAATLKVTPAAAAPDGPRQSFLFATDELKAATEAAEARGEYTAERLREQDRAKYNLTLELLGANWPQRKIAETLKLHHRTVAAVQDNEPEAIDAIRQLLIRKLRTAGTLQVERLTEHPDLVPMQYAANTAKEMLTLAELLDGKATARVEHSGSIDIFGDWETVIAEQLQPADVIEIGSDAEKEKHIGNSAAPLELPDRDPLAGSDTESEAERSIAEAAARRDTTVDTDRGAKSERLDGGGGVRSAEGRGHDATRNNPQKFSGHSGRSEDRS